MSKFTQRYFLILKDYFSDLVDQTSKKGLSDLESYQATSEIYSPSLMKTMMESLHDELIDLNWSAQRDSIRKIGGLKTAYAGHSQMFTKSPTMVYDSLKKMCMYADTIIISDPILSELLTWQKRQTGGAPSFHLIAQWARRFVALEDLFSSDLDPPICVLAPSYVLSLEQENLLETTNRFIVENVVPMFASHLFGYDFASSGELEEYLSQIKDFNEFTSLVHKPEMLVNLDGSPVCKNDFQYIREYYSSKYERELSLHDSFLALIRSRISGGIYDLILSGKMTSNFVTDLKGTWDALHWVIRNDNELVFEHLKKTSISKDMLVMNALQQERLKWLGNVPLDRIKRLRERGELQEIRDILRQNTKKIENASDEEFVEVGRQVKHNLEEAFKRHDSEVKKLNEKYRRRYSIDGASIAVSGSLAIVSALFPPLALAASIASTIIGSGSTMQIVRDFLSKREQNEALQKKPVAMLFDAHKSVT